LKLVGRVPRATLASGALVRMRYPPWDVLVALVDGEPCAIEDSCNHAGASLAEGGRDDSGRCVVCPMHGYLFELTTGKLVAPLGLCDNQRAFVTRTEGDEVVVYDPVNIVILK
jgi:nitrite reductase/ring-hydroxylating ferredoxin subunit